MKHNIYSLFLASAAIIALSGCEKENVFKFNAEEGQLNCAALSVDYINSGTRASGVNIDEFTVNFVNDETDEVVKSYPYSELPEIVSLPAGKYRAEASYGNKDLEAAWENPVYAGSSSFSIVKGELTDDVDPIECSLQNMKVEVNVLDETGMNIVGSDVKVVVKAGKNGELPYDSEHKDSIGYFKFDEGSNTIAAELSGTLDGEFTDGIVRIYQDAGRGKAYRIRFFINRPDNVGDGDIHVGDGIKVDATISVKDENIIVDPGEPEEDFVDVMRPTEQNPDDPGKEPGTDPGKDPGTNPGDDPQPSGEKPQVKFPEGSGIELDMPFEVSEDTKVEFDVTSESGITDFIIDIDSANLSPLLPGVGLDTHLDLVNPGPLKEGLESLGFPTGDNVKGKKEVHFDISEFIPLLGIYGAGDHKFVMTITDANGNTTNGTLWLQTK